MSDSDREAQDLFSTFDMNQWSLESTTDLTQHRGHDALPNALESVSRPLQSTEPNSASPDIPRAAGVPPPTVSNGEAFTSSPSRKRRRMFGYETPNAYSQSSFSKPPSPAITSGASDRRSRASRVLRQKLRTLMQKQDGPCIAMHYRDQGKEGVVCQPILYFTPTPIHRFSEFSSPLEVPLKESCSLALADKSFLSMSISGLGTKGKNLQPQNVKRSRDIEDEPQSIFARATCDHANPLNTEKVPVEIFELIAKCLTRDDVKCMRLVSHDWESKVARYLFRSVVVPFNTEIYGMLARQPSPLVTASRQSEQTAPENVVVRGRQVLSPFGDTPMHWNVAMFGGFGPHIRQFGISLDFDEASLLKPPAKPIRPGQDSYWGDFYWPSKDYQRFADRAGLEGTADETASMVKAFSKFKDLVDLALSLDSGLGYLNGPDQSLQAEMLARPCKVFDSTRFETDRQVVSKRALWSLIEKTYASTRSDANLNFSAAVRARFPPDTPPTTAEVEKIECGDLWLDSLKAYDHRFWYQVNSSAIKRDQDEWMPDTNLQGRSETGIFLIQTCSTNQFVKANIRDHVNPEHLTEAQKEWLLETAWAQDAFLSSYMLSIADNASVFCKVETLTIARISSRHLHKLCREDFWKSLPSLTNFSIRVIADWRDVEKDHIGNVNTPPIHPSNAVTSFHQLLSTLVANRSSIKTLSLGWVQGGEHAQGVKARNRYLLPAPLTSKYCITTTRCDDSRDMLCLPFVENFTLANCWVTPDTLTAFVTRHSSLKLANLTLESVSLTAHPRTTARQYLVPGGTRSRINPLSMAQLRGMGYSQLLSLAMRLDLHARDDVWDLVPDPPSAPVLLTQHYRQIYPSDYDLRRAIYRHGFGTEEDLEQIPLMPPALPLLQPSGAPQGPPEPPPPTEYRSGSWPDILATIHRVIADSNVQQASNRTALASSSSGQKPRQPAQTLTLRVLSAGYARVPTSRPNVRSIFGRTQADLLAVETAAAAASLSGNGTAYQARHNIHFRNVRESLEGITMASMDECFGAVIQGMDAGEVNDLLHIWGLAVGWPSRELVGEAAGLQDESEWQWGIWAERAAKGVEADGGLRGGAGRVSGKIVFSDGLDCIEKESNA